MPTSATSICIAYFVCLPGEVNASGMLARADAALYAAKASGRDRFQPGVVGSGGLANSTLEVSHLA